MTLSRFLPPAAIVLAAFLAAGCGAVGRVTSGDPSQGKALFLQDCAACHTLADAKSTGTIGPNLDDAFSSDKEQGDTSMFQESASKQSYGVSRP